MSAVRHDYGDRHVQMHKDHGCGWCLIDLRKHPEHDEALCRQSAASFHGFHLPTERFDIPDEEC